MKETITTYNYDGTILGIEEADVPELSAEEMRTIYEKLTVSYIREQYSSDDENKIMREYLAYGDTFKARFEEYNTYVETCKTRARMDVYGEEVST